MNKPILIVKFSPFFIYFKRIRTKVRLTCSWWKLKCLILRTWSSLRRRSCLCWRTLIRTTSGTRTRTTSIIRTTRTTRITLNWISCWTTTWRIRSYSSSSRNCWSLIRGCRRTFIIRRSSCCCWNWISWTISLSWSSRSRITSRSCWRITLNRSCWRITINWSCCWSWITITLRRE